MYSCNDTRCRVGCPIRISTDQRLLAAPRGFSQRATSFIASWCQGIHRMPFCRSILLLQLRSHTYHQRTRTRFSDLPTMHRNHPSRTARNSELWSLAGILSHEVFQADLGDHPFPLHGLIHLNTRTDSHYDSHAHAQLSWSDNP